jgi:hypothetical protein
MPNTIAQNLQRLQTAKTDIANAITTMGGTVTSGDGFEDFPAEILGIPVGGEVTIDRVYLTTSEPSSSYNIAVYNPSNCTLGTLTSVASYARVVATRSNVFIILPVTISATVSGYRSLRATVSYNVHSSLETLYGFDKYSNYTLYDYRKEEPYYAEATVTMSNYNTIEMDLPFYNTSSARYYSFGCFTIKYDKT